MHDIVNNASEGELAQLNLDADLLQEVKRATVDLWVLRAFGYDVDAAGTQDMGRGNDHPIEWLFLEHPAVVRIGSGVMPPGYGLCQRGVNLRYGQKTGVRITSAT